MLNLSSAAHFANAKVPEHDDPVTPEEYVLCLQVPVKDLMAVYVHESGCHLQTTGITAK